MIVSIQSYNEILSDNGKSSPVDFKGLYLLMYSLNQEINESVHVKQI